MSKIIALRARQVLDSRGIPTVQVEARTRLHSAIASVPSGVSKGKREAIELRDNKSAFFGKGVLQAVEHVNKKIANAVIQRDCLAQEQIDSIMIELDGTKDKSVLGANAILPVSMAVCRLGAKEKGMELFEHIAELSRNNYFEMPFPVMNFIEGSVHAGNSLSFQEFHLIVKKFSFFADAMQMASENYYLLKDLLQKHAGKNSTNVGLEGGFAPNLNSVELALEFLQKALEQSGYENDCFLGIDAAANNFFRDERYFVNGKEFLASELMDFYEKLIERFSLHSIEDPFAESQWQDWIDFNKKFGEKIKVVGDDLVVSSFDLIKDAVQSKACNAIILKLNQIGTVTEAIKSFHTAKFVGFDAIVTHRAAETNDPFIADFCVGIGAKYCKFGGMQRGERIAKYNRLLRIAELLDK